MLVLWKQILFHDDTDILQYYKYNQLYANFRSTELKDRPPRPVWYADTNYASMFFSANPF